jgi:uncharacterized phage protein (TIGR01671 family)
VTPKFRAWIKDYQVMRSVEFLAFNEKGVAEIFTNPEDGEPEDFRHTHSPEQAILMQSTGLKDCNGEEIYEGDVLFCGERHKGDKSYKGEVVFWQFDERGNSIYTTTEKMVVNSFPHNLKMLEEADRLQILGNIYENPELLEEAR